MRRWLKRGALALLACVVAFLLYWSDKRKAREDSWRTPENVLHAVELAGGWPGALIAQQVFRHKTRKQPFASALLAILIAQLVLALFWLNQA